MNNKIITAIVCALIAVCLSVGIAMHFKGGNSENEASAVSSIKTASETESRTDSDDITETKNKHENVLPTSDKASEITAGQQTAAPSKKETQTYSGEKTTKTAAAKQTETSSEKENPKTSVKQTEVNSEKETQAQLQVLFSVNCERAAAYGADYPKYLINKTKCNVKKGTTVFDLLSEECRKEGIAVVHQNKSYVVSIGGLAEKDCGNSSGWMYTVNGKKPMMAGSRYILQDGDIVEWYYVTSPTD